MQIIDKVLTMQDVEVLNAEKNSTVILKNTVGQSVDVIRNLSPKVTIQIIGGYDGDKKRKYDAKRIQVRTFYTPNEVCDIIIKFEEYESGIDPTWTDLEKSLYMYKKFADTIKYEEDNGNKSRNLNTILGKGVCAGYSIVFKEAMDRLGIECDIVNEPGVHTWNSIKIDDKWYPLDLTWDANNIQNKNDNNIRWFGQNPAFNKYKNHSALGEDVIPNNCFDTETIARTLNKVTSSNIYSPIEQEEAIETIFSRVIVEAGQGCDLNKIQSGIMEIANFAFGVGAIYNDTAYTKEFDQKFGDIFKEIKNNDNLTDEQKHTLLRITHNTWADVMGKIHTGSIHESLKSEISTYLRRISFLVGNKDYLSIDRDFINMQLKDIYKRCTTFGVVDVSKLEEMSKQIKQQLEEIQKAQEDGKEVGTLDTQIKIEGPIQIIEAQPVEYNNLERWASIQIAQYETFINGIKESRENIEDAETQDILSACTRALECLYSNYPQLSQNHGKGI